MHTIPRIRAATPVYAARTAYPSLSVTTPKCPTRGTPTMQSNPILAMTRTSLRNAGSHSSESESSEVYSIQNGRAVVADPKNPNRKVDPKLTSEYELGAGSK